MQVYRSHSIAMDYYEKKMLRQSQNSSINRSINVTQGEPEQISMPMILDPSR